ncbi:MAG: phosphatase PAP2 family protein [Ruminococcaceae bacterium]|nr:phosphatase PAP2 family protein [Oscillospiraceae bacterium]
MWEALTGWENSFLHTLQDGATETGDVIWTAITTFGEAGIFWIALSVILMLFPKTRKAGFTMGLALLIGVIVGNGVLKNVIARPRPYDFDPSLSCRLAWGKMSTDFSFPSGHTLASFEAAVGLFIRHKKWGSAALVLAFLVCISRLFLIVHYPSDVIAGAILGTLFAILSAKVVDILWKKWESRT